MTQITIHPLLMLIPITIPISRSFEPPAHQSIHQRGSDFMKDSYEESKDKRDSVKRDWVYFIQVSE